MAQEEAIVAAIHTGPLGRVEAADQAEVFGGEADKAQDHSDKFAGWLGFVGRGRGLG